MNNEMTQHAGHAMQEICTVRSNTLYDDGDRYYVTHTNSGVFFAFDRNKQILRKLIRDIRNYGTLTSAGKKMFWCKRPRRKATTLRMWLYSKYNKIPLREMRGKAVMLADDVPGHIVDYTSQNLYLAGQGHRLNNATRTLDVVECGAAIGMPVTLIKFHAKAANVDVYFSHDELLLAILQRNALTPGMVGKTNGKRRLFLCDNAAGYSFYAHELAYACYHGWIRSEGSYIDDLKKFKQHAAAKEMEIDHADCIQSNSTKPNLSLMPLALNRAKNDIAAHFRGDYGLVIAYCHEQYRVRFCALASPERTPIPAAYRQSSPVMSSMLFLAETPKDLVRLLKALYSKVRLSWASSPNQTAQEHEKTTDKPYWARGDTELAILTQEELCRVEEDQFERNF